MESTASALNRRAAGAFFLALSGAAAWFRLNLRASGLAAGPVPWRLVLLLVSVAVFLYGLWRGLKRSSFAPTARGAAWFIVALVLGLWLASIWTLAAKGIFQRSIGVVPVLPLAIFTPIVIGSLVLTRWKAVGLLLDATPVSWLVGLQVYRILGAAFIVYWIHGTMPGVFALPAGVGDVLVGLLALPAAIWAASNLPIGRSIGVRWNVLGLTDFVIAISTGALTSPGPAHLLAVDHPNLQLATFPTVMIPAFIVPFSALLHLLSLRQFHRKQAKGSITQPDMTIDGGRMRNAVGVS